MCLFLIILGEPVSYPVNQVDGFELTIEKPTWSPFKGYTIRWAVTANSKEIYSFGEDGSPGFEYLERHIDWQWYRLTYSQDIFPFNNFVVIHIIGIVNNNTDMPKSCFQNSNDCHKLRNNAPINIFIFSLPPNTFIFFF
mgnify:FL=1